MASDDGDEAQVKARRSAAEYAASARLSGTKLELPSWSGSGAKGSRYATERHQAEACLRELLKLADESPDQPVVVGYDTEAPVIWNQSGSTNLPTALMQLSYHPPSRVPGVPGMDQPVCLLLQLSEVGFMEEMQQVLEHPNIFKVGVGVAGDLRDLGRDLENAEAGRGVVDLDELACACGVEKTTQSAAAERKAQMTQNGFQAFSRGEKWGLAGLLEHVSGYTLRKYRKITRSDWGAVPLRQQQLAYAAADAYAVHCKPDDRVLLPQQNNVPAESLSEQMAELQMQTSSSLWQQYQPAISLWQHWQNEVLQPVLQASAAELERLLIRAEEKQQVGDGQEWMQPHEQYMESGDWKE
eukprot:gene11735-11879_t